MICLFERVEIPQIHSLVYVFIGNTIDNEGLSRKLVSICALLISLPPLTTIRRLRQRDCGPLAAFGHNDLSPRWRLT